MILVTSVLKSAKTTKCSGLATSYWYGVRVFAYSYLAICISYTYLTYYHLLMIGGKNIKKFSEFLPERASHRYTLENQITMDASFKASLSQYKLFWILNCTWYCPVSVALMEWHAYLVKLVENWWCPFTHSKKEGYSNATIDKSFWHIYPEDNAKLNSEDRNNPIWNEDTAGK